MVDMTHSDGVLSWEETEACALWLSIFLGLGLYDFCGHMLGKTFHQVLLV
jgi:hypothetical protein